jgi:hypothetical protein
MRSNLQRLERRVFLQNTSSLPLGIRVKQHCLDMTHTYQDDGEVSWFCHMSTYNSWRSAHVRKNLQHKTRIYCQSRDQQEYPKHRRIARANRR